MSYLREGLKQIIEGSGRPSFSVGDLFIPRDPYNKLDADEMLAQELNKLAEAHYNDFSMLLKISNTKYGYMVTLKCIRPKEDGDGTVEVIYD